MPRSSAGGRSSSAPISGEFAESRVPALRRGAAPTISARYRGHPSCRFSEHAWWDTGQGWKNILNNLRLILQPYVYYCLLLPWLLVFDIPGLRAGFLQLTGIMNSFHAALPT